MTATLPAYVRTSKFHDHLLDAGLCLTHQGKVRDIYEYSLYPDFLVMVATDRISIFDIVLLALIPRKGEVLTALTHFWLTGPLRSYPNQFDEDMHKRVLKELIQKSKHPLPVFQMLVVRKIRIPPYELIFRHHLGGSVYGEYEEYGTVAGELLPSGISKWGYLENPVFTPSTKTDYGHDINISVKEFYAHADEDMKYAVEICKKAYITAYNFARARNILILDTKFEGIVLADEVLTPDSSRFALAGDFSYAMRKGLDPFFYDKEFVRDWGRSVITPWGKGLQRLDPKNKDHMAFAHSLEVPDTVMLPTTARYCAIFEKIVFPQYGTLQKYQESRMKIVV